MKRSYALIRNLMRSRYFAIAIKTPGIVVLSALLSFAQYKRDTDFSVEQSLKSNARVNPSTLAMELSIPIGGYMGRGGNALPLVFNYSSKVWQIQYMDSWESQYGLKSDTTPMYAKRTAAGWTSNLGVPRIDDHFQMYRPLVSVCGSLYDGELFDVVPSIEPPNPECQSYPIYYVKRMFIVMPDGSSHEFRKDDARHNYGTAVSPGGPGLPDQMGTFLSVDGSRMRFEKTETEATLFLPDGGRYLFGIGTTATTFIDRNGNKMSYDISNHRWTDTMGRMIDDPMPMNWDNFEQNQVVEDKVASFPSIDGGTMNVTLSWRYLKDPTGGESGLEDANLTLHNLSNIGCQGNVNRQIDPPHLFINPEITLARVCNPIAFIGYDWWPKPPFNPIVLTKITLPNGQTYEFKYNVYGEVTKIVYPTGAYERFQYGPAPVLQPQGPTYDQASRGVTSRWVSEKGDGTDEIQWTYSGWLTNAPDGTKTQRFVFTEGYQTPKPYGFGSEKTGMPYEERVLSPTDQILRRKLTSYEVTGPLSGGRQEATRDVRPNREISIIFEPGASQAIASMTETIYDTHSDPEFFAQLNAKQVKNHNYVVLDLNTAQTANIDTLAALFSNSTLATVSEMDYLYDANYKARNITGLVTETRVKDASGNVRAKTQISYDDANHSVSSFGTMPTAASGSWIDPVTELGATLGAKRGLPTVVKSYHDITNGNYIQTESFYDQFGNVSKARDGRGNDTEMQYDDDYAFAYPTKTITPIPDSSGTYGSNAAFESTVTYDYNTGLPLTSTDANGQTTVMEYDDPLLRPTKVTAPNGHETVTDYGAGTSASTRWVKVTSDIDETSSKYAISWFDGLGRNWLSQSEDSAGDVFAVTCYDSMGRVAKTSNPFRGYSTQSCSTANGTSNIYWTTPAYDDLGRTVSVTTPDSAVVSTAYSLATSGTLGASVTVTDQAGKLRRSVTNALGQLIRVDEPNSSNQLGTIGSPNQPTYYSYDTLNNLTTVTQGAQTRTFTYDALSRLKSATNPESGTISYTYDANSNLATKTDARSITTTYTYDRLNRVTQRSYSGESGYSTPAVSYFYDNLTNAKGKLIKVASSVSTTEYTGFDILGRVTAHKQTTDGNEYTTAYTYSLSGQLLEQTYPSGRVVKNTFDADGALSQVQSKRSSETYRNFANGFVYNAAGAVTAMKLGNGRWENTTFNSRLQPTQIGLGAGAYSQSLLKLEYSYGTTANNGNVVSQTITVPGVADPFIQTYAYDSLNRLTNAEETQNSAQTWKQTFTFDRYGNRNFDEANTTTLPKNCGTSPNFTVCTADRKIVNPSVNTANNRLSTSDDYIFDNSGNTTRDAESRRFTYDAENKQTKVETLDGSGNPIVTVGEYLYDGDGKRVKKVVPGGETTVFVYDAGGKLIGEYSTVVQPVQDAKTVYTTNDHLGSPRINTDGIGQVISRHDYHPFGEEVSRSGYGSDTIRKQFTGYERDGETGLDFAQARYFASSHGRFSSPDDFRFDTHQSSPQSWNLYSYARNNPMKLVDPQGMKVKVSTRHNKDTNTTTVKISGTFAMYAAEGQEVTAEELARQAGLLKAGINEQWHSGKFTVNGINYVIETDVSVTTFGNKEDAIASRSDNVVEIGTWDLPESAAVVSNDGSSSYDFMRMEVNSANSDEYFKIAYGHEFGHLAGLPDGKTGLMDNVVPGQLNTENFIELFSGRDELSVGGPPSSSSGKFKINGKYVSQKSEPIHFTRAQTQVLTSTNSSFSTLRAPVGPTRDWVRRTQVP